MGGGGGSKAVYKLYKKTGEMVRGAFPNCNTSCVLYYYLPTGSVICLCVCLKFETDQSWPGIEGSRLSLDLGTLPNNSH